jgi:hypothetical protein
VHSFWFISADLDIELCMQLLPCLFKEDASYIYAPDGQVFNQVSHILSKLLRKIIILTNSIVYVSYFDSYANTNSINITAQNIILNFQETLLMDLAS